MEWKEMRMRRREVALNIRLKCLAVESHWSLRSGVILIAWKTPEQIMFWRCVFPHRLTEFGLISISLVHTWKNGEWKAH